MAPEPRRQFAVPIPVEIRHPDGRTEVEYAVNLSPGGLCLHAKLPLAVGERIRVVFCVPPAGCRVESEAQVVWSMPQGTGELFETGIHLEHSDFAVFAELHDWASQPVDRRR